MFFIIILFFNLYLLFNCNARCNVSINIKIDFSKMYKLNHIKRKFYFLLKKPMQLFCCLFTYGINRKSYLSVRDAK